MGHNAPKENWENMFKETRSECDDDTGQLVEKPRGVMGMRVKKKATAVVRGRCVLRVHVYLKFSNSFKLK